LVRSSSPAGVPTAEFREKMRELDPMLAVFEIQPMNTVVSRTLARPRFNLTLLGVFAIIAFLLAAVGVYGLISYSVSQRTREMGIRMALGAGRGSILKLVVGQGSALALIGVIIGLALSFALTRVLGSLLYGVTATDPATFVIVTLLLIAVALLASYLPARRATRVDPILALRVE
jgi:putative ABC transport system permease protein